ncbi:MAG: signal transduction histidine kinase [Porticoccaceae bacterium]|jgi:signal transduction histidine kinase
MTGFVTAKPVRSLVAQSRRQLSYIALVIFICFFALVSTFTFYQIDVASDSFFRLEALKISTAISEDAAYELPRRHELSAFRSWDNIPPEIRALFSSNAIEDGSTLDVEWMDETGVREYGYLLYLNDPSLGDFYLIGFENADEVDVIVSSIIEKTFVDSIILVSIVCLLLFSVIFWVFKNSFRPLSLLVEWSESVRKNPEDEIAANFSISELNEIADHLLYTLNKAKQFNEREKQFLKHASHELRTPLAIIQASLDTVMFRLSDDDVNYVSLQRAGRANTTMIQLSEALLWLARESDKKIQKVMVSPGKSCNQIISDLNYLIQNNCVELSLINKSTFIQIEKDLFFIVLSNIIRNALQYTSLGEVIINIDNNSVEITNDVDVNDDRDQEFASFGLGLQLVERIANKLGWLFAFNINDRVATVKIIWDPVTNSV